jgi:FAD/FMN-containing dehydrogenase
MNATAYNPDNRIASIQPGGNWGSVYSALAPHGVVVPGGRGSGVGIAGFLLGGGNSFFNSAHGWGCDSVDNFEVVLADGRIVDASARENRDLWIALRGGSGNFGLVTRFDLRTIPYADPDDPVIWGGAVFWDANATEGLVDAIVDFGNNAADDVYSTSFCMWGLDPIDPPVVACSLNNILNVPSAPAFDGYMAVGGVISDTLRSASMLNLTEEQNGGGGFQYIPPTN